MFQNTALCKRKSKRKLFNGASEYLGRPQAHFRTGKSTIINIAQHSNKPLRKRKSKVQRTFRKSFPCRSHVMIATSKPFLFFLILFLGIICAVVIEEDEFYCKMEKEKFRICRRCPEISGRCPTDPEDCRSVHVFIDQTYLSKVPRFASQVSVLHVLG